MGVARRKLKIKSPVPIAVFASGRGSNFEAIALAIKKKKLHAEILALITENPDAHAVKIAKKYKIPVECVEVPRFSGLQGAGLRAAHEDRVLGVLKKYDPRFLIMAGYMRLLGPTLLSPYRDSRGFCRIVNVHPSLLPAFRGVDAYQQAFEYGVKVTGATVHFVDLEVDAGPICAQEVFSIETCKSPAEVEKLGLLVEHRLFPQTLQWVLSESFEIEKRKGRPCVRPH